MRVQDEQVETEEGAQQDTAPRRDRERHFIRRLIESAKQRTNHTHGQLLLGEPGQVGRKSAVQNRKLGSVSVYSAEMQQKAAERSSACDWTAPPERQSAKPQDAHMRHPPTRQLIPAHLQRLLNKMGGGVEIRGSEPLVAGDNQLCDHMVPADARNGTRLEPLNVTVVIIIRLGEM